MSFQIPRRQKRSCLQCQKAKRACDGYALNRDPGPGSSLASSPTSLSSSDQDYISSIRPCSYCQKTSKACSLNAIWGLTRIRVNQGSYNPSVPRPFKNRVSDRTLSEGSPSPIKAEAVTSPYEYTSSSVKSTSQSDAEPSQYRQKWIYSEQKISTVLSPSTANVSMAAVFNNQLITRSLLCIYHDVLENNLSCWISEVTCPYSMSYSSQESIAPALTDDDAAYSSCTFGPTNPFYQYIFRLDRATQRFWKPLSHKEDMAVSRTLHLCILAFAAQWTQKQARKRTVSSTSVGHLYHSDTPITMPMDYSLQLLLWEQARTALQQNMEIECFRIVYAEFIFGITERPEPRYNQDYSSHRDDICLSRDQHSVIHFIGHIMSNERPSVHLEQATRKMFALKYRFEMEELKSKRGPRDTYALQRRRTVGFIYWLLVMFDTVVSPLNKRPVVIADEHCMTDSILNTEDEPCQWRLDMFLKDDSEMPQSLRWPCSEEVASRAMIKAAPIKVLLYRQLSYIQNALRKKSSIQNIINATKGAITVCRYWDMTYASFFQERVFVTDKGERFEVPIGQVRWKKPLGKRVVIVDTDTRLDGKTKNTMLNECPLDFTTLPGRTGGHLNHYIYAMIHGYDYRLVRAADYPDRHGTWVKPAITKEALKTHDFVISLDSDAVFTHLDLPLEWLMNLWDYRPETLVAMAYDLDWEQDYDPQGNLILNTGFVIAQASQRTQDMFQRWEDCPRSIPGCDHWNFKWAHEQSAFSYYIRYEFNRTHDVKNIPCNQANGNEFTLDGNGECKGVFVSHNWKHKHKTPELLSRSIMTSLARRVHGQFHHDIKDLYIDASKETYPIADGAT
ncbi:Nucleotide-diphospho-sugar transferase [Fusarium oxysporum f. sp. vasinfectum]|nr:Nucleotide-diphospho-sugar transferase [Fusarium oxysporum f. sp. vasinfectum]